MKVLEIPIVIGAFGTVTKTLINGFENKILRSGIFGDFLLLIKHTFCSCYLIFPGSYWLPGNSTFGSWFGWYTLGCFFYMDSNKIFIFIISVMSFRCLLNSIKLFSRGYHILFAYRQVRTRHIVPLYHLFLISAYIQTNLYWDDSVIRRYTFKEGISFTVQSAVDPLPHNLVVLSVIWVAINPFFFLLFFFFFFFFECASVKTTWSYLPTPPLGQDMIQGQFLSGV